ncbi:MAG: glutathione ABC transporter permease GsiD [Rhizobiales bacterium 65-9]|nr:ABC transporter permease [Hyphomicrobiales bacterium]OJY38062.1 MAG: glutathione ABC transporter permease GsiD [Rhizobiales bacterium 65-9]
MKRLLWRDATLTFAALLVAAHVLAAIAAPLIAPHDPLAQNIIARLKGPSADNWLGADQLGRDVFSRILYGYRTSLAVSLGAVFASLLAGGALGLLAAFYKGWFERIVMRCMDALFAFPVLLLAIGVVAMLGPQASSAAIAIAIVYTPIFARLMRAAALVVIESEFVVAAKTIGCSDARLLVRHVLPNLASVMIAQTALMLSAAILVEASLSFLGLGAQPPSPSLGLMLAEGRNFLMLSPWSAIFAGLAILILSFGFNLLGDALRDRLDPRLRGG